MNEKISTRLAILKEKRGNKAKGKLFQALPIVEPKNSEKSEEILKNLLCSSSSHERIIGIESAMLIEPKKRISLLGSLITNSDPEVRFALTEALIDAFECGEKTAESVLQELVNDPDSEIRSLVCAATKISNESPVAFQVVCDKKIQEKQWLKATSVQEEFPSIVKLDSEETYSKFNTATLKDAPKKVRFYQKTFMAKYFPILAAIFIVVFYISYQLYVSSSGENKNDNKYIILVSANKQQSVNDKIENIYPILASASINNEEKQKLQKLLNEIQNLNSENKQNKKSLDNLEIYFGSFNFENAQSLKSELDDLIEILGEDDEK